MRNFLSIFVRQENVVTFNSIVHHFRVSITPTTTIKRISWRARDEGDEAFYRRRRTTGCTQTSLPAIQAKPTKSARLIGCNDAFNKCCLCGKSHIQQIVVMLAGRAVPLAITLWSCVTFVVDFLVFQPSSMLHHFRVVDSMTQLMCQMLLPNKYRNVGGLYVLKCNEKPSTDNRKG